MVLWNVAAKHDSKESALAASGQHPRQQLSELRAYLEGMDPGPSLETCPEILFWQDHQAVLNVNLEFD